MPRRADQPTRKLNAVARLQTYWRPTVKVGIVVGALAFIGWVSGCVEPVPYDEQSVNALEVAPDYRVLLPKVGAWDILQPGENRKAVIQSVENLSSEDWNLVLADYTERIRSHASYRQAAGVDIEAVDPGLFPNYPDCVRKDLRVTFMGYERDIKFWASREEPLSRTPECEEGYLDTKLGGRNELGYDVSVDVDVQRGEYTNSWPGIWLDSGETLHSAAVFHLHEPPGTYTISVLVKRYLPEASESSHQFDNIDLTPGDYFITLTSDGAGLKWPDSGS